MRKSIKVQNAMFVIYGGGEVGNNCFQALSDSGYKVAYALDKNKCGDNVIIGTHTYKLGVIPKEICKEEHIVIVCLADGMAHKYVADSLYEEGYRYIVFLPMQHCLKDSTKRELTRKYNAFMHGYSSVLQEMVFDYGEYYFPDLSNDNAIIRYDEKTFTVWCGLEMLFSESLELWKGDKTKIFTKSKYKDKHIALNNPCKVLFDYFGMKNKSYEKYFFSKKKDITEEEKNKQLMEREKLYHVFKSEHNKGLDFFIDGAPLAVWNPKKYWNLVGGHHRTLYLLYEGHSIFPVKVSKEEFNIWSNEKHYKELEKYIRVNKIVSFYAPLPHPAFINFPSKHENNGKTKMEAVAQFLADEDIAQVSVLDCMEDEGYFARIMVRMGVIKSVFRSNCKEQLELAELFNKLLYRDDVVLENEDIASLSLSYDIIFGRVEQEEYLKTVCTRFLFIEREININGELSQGTPQNYTVLLQEYYNGMIHEFGVYNFS